MLSLEKNSVQDNVYMILKMGQSYFGFTLCVFKVIKGKLKNTFRL